MGAIERDLLSKYLVQNGYRKTAERFAILDEIDEIEGHFDIETLYVAMKNKKYSISKATLYNNIGILIEAGLLKKHQFGDNFAIYEKVFSRSQHDHFICTMCGRVTEFYDPRIADVERTIEESHGSKVSHHSLYLYGICNDCLNNKDKNKK